MNVATSEIQTDKNIDEPKVLLRPTWTTGDSNLSPRFLEKGAEGPLPRLGFTTGYRPLHVGYGAGQRHAGVRVLQILAIVSLISGLVLPGNSWSQALPDQTAVPPATNPSWTVTGNLNSPRYGHTATLLADGHVLIAGGLNCTPLPFRVINTAELYEPATGTWNSTGHLNIGRGGHTATLLPNGQVLVTGGLDGTASQFSVTDSTELYDPATGTWSGTGRLNMSRSGHTAILLANGQVLVAGGVAAGYIPLGSAELYDPATGAWSLTGNLGTARSSHLATLLASGKVLVAGGYIYMEPYFLRSAELYDPANGSWSRVDNLNRPWAYTATPLPSGEVLVAEWNTAEVYEPITGRWSAAGTFNSSREAYTSTLLPDGQVLVAGGYNYNGDNPYSKAELYDPTTRIWTTTASLSAGRYNHTATLLSDGKVLVTGGLDAFGVALKSAELFDLGLPRLAR